MSALDTSAMNLPSPSLYGMSIPNPHAALPLVNMFKDASGREYTLTWSNGTGKGQSGYIRMTDLLFNYYFYPTAFGLDGAYREKVVAPKTGIRMVREIGAPYISYNRGSYTRKIVPTFRTSAYDTGTQLYAVDGDDLWNFEIGGRIEEFRIWVETQARLTNLKRVFNYRTITGVGAAAAPITASANP